MRNSKLGLRALGLAILGALSLTAFLAAGAQAQLPGESKVGQFQINLVSALLATFQAEGEGTRRILIPGRNLLIECNSWVTTNAKINKAEAALVTVLSASCTAWNLALTNPLPCQILSPGEPVGSIAAQALLLPILHGGQNFVLFEPAPGTLNFTEVELHGETCPLPLVNPVKGSIVAQVVINDAITSLIAFDQAIQTLSGDKFAFGGFPAFIDASAVVKLTGEHAGDQLGVV